MITHAAQFINGEWLAGQGEAFSSLNPANNDVIWQANSATADQVDIAVKSARNAFYSWSGMALDARLEVVKRFAELLKENSEELAIAIAKETCKPLWETRTEAGAMVGKIPVSEKAYHERTGVVENAMISLAAWKSPSSSMTNLRVPLLWKFICPPLESEK